MYTVSRRARVAFESKNPGEFCLSCSNVGVRGSAGLLCSSCELRAHNLLVRRNRRECPGYGAGAQPLVRRMPPSRFERDKIRVAQRISVARHPVQD